MAKEEKTHVGELQALLLRLDREQVQELERIAVLSPVNTGPAA